MRWITVVLLGFGMLAAAAACGGGDNTGPKARTSEPTSAVATQSAPETPTPVKDPTLTEILDKHKNSIVEIVVSGAGGDFGGTGFAWENGKTIITNAHVVIGAASIKVNDPLEKGKQYPAVLVALSACDDVAILSVERANFTPVKIGDSSKIQAGSPVVALGFPGTAGTSGSGGGLVVTEGNASRLGASFPDSGQRDLVQHTAPINPGNSGGPLLNKQGEVIGINSYSVRGAQAENYAISINEAKFVADKLKGGKNLDYLGMRVVTNNRDLAKQNSLPYIDGLAILGVSAGSPATKAKPYPLKAGYTVGFIDGKFIDTVGTYCDVLRSHKPGDTVALRFGAFDQNNKSALYDVELVVE